MVEHRAHRADRQPVAHCLAHVDQQYAHPVGGLGAFFTRRCAAQQYHQVRMLGTADPDLLSVDDVIVALAPREGGDTGRIGARSRLGHAESLQPQFAAGDLRQVMALLFLRAMLQERAHRIHLRVAGAAIRARAVDLLQNGTGGLQPQTRSVIFFRDQHRKKARLGQRGHEFAWIGALAIKLLPIFTREARAQPPHRFADFRKGLAQRSVSHCNLFAAHRALWQRQMMGRLGRPDCIARSREPAMRSLRRYERGGRNNFQGGPPPRRASSLRPHPGGTE